MYVCVVLSSIKALCFWGDQIPYEPVLLVITSKCLGTNFAHNRDIWLVWLIIKLIDHFRYIKIQSKTIDLSTRLLGITTEFVGFIPQSLVLRSIVLGWILRHGNWFDKFCRATQLWHGSDSNIVPLPCQTKFIQYICILAGLLSRGALRGDHEKNSPLQSMRIECYQKRYQKWKHGRLANCVKFEIAANNKPEGCLVHTECLLFLL